MTKAFSVEHSQNPQKSTQELNIKDRLYIFRTISTLPISQFEELCFTLNPPKGVIPPDFAPLGSRSKALLDWAESPTGPGILAVEGVLQEFLPQHITPKQSDEPKAFAISGKMGDLSSEELKAIVELLRQKTGDNSIDIAFSTDGSIKLVLNGTPEGLEKLQNLFDTGALTKVLDDRPVEYVNSIDRDTTEARKARLLQALRFYTDKDVVTDNIVNNIIDEVTSVRHLINEIDNLIREFDTKINLASKFNLIPEFCIEKDVNVTVELVGIREIAQGIKDDLHNDLNNEHIKGIAEKLVRLLNRQVIGIFEMAYNLNEALGGGLDHSIVVANKIIEALYGYRDFVQDFLRDLQFSDESLQNVIRKLDRAIGATFQLSFDVTEQLNQIPTEATASTGSTTDENSSKAIDLRGANLSGLVLVGMDMTGVDFKDAIVDGTVFGYNFGLTSKDKADLEKRGAIFKEEPGPHVLQLIKQ